jgi:hypothetical protein
VTSEEELSQAEEDGFSAEQCEPREPPTNPGGGPPGGG